MRVSSGWAWPTRSLLVVACLWSGMARAEPGAASDASSAEKRLADANTALKQREAAADAARREVDELAGRHAWLTVALSKPTAPNRPKLEQERRAVVGRMPEAKWAAAEAVAAATRARSEVAVAEHADRVALAASKGEAAPGPAPDVKPVIATLQPMFDELPPALRPPAGGWWDKFDVIKVRELIGPRAVGSTFVIPATEHAIRVEPRAAKEGAAWQVRISFAYERPRLTVGGQPVAARVTVEPVLWSGSCTFAVDEATARAWDKRKPGRTVYLTGTVRKVTIEAIRQYGVEMVIGDVKGLEQFAR
ncbi:MAG TPA: hypothetical protein VEA69_06980 [Tepidisphaeraceae bacterium]|nr:hypothetical protein [Tepidisphaeraceae bacterium]